MLTIIGITADTLQKQRMVLPDGTFLTMTICFKPMQLGWFIQELVHDAFTLNGVRIVVSPNMLQQFRNQIPFGLACFSTGNREPQLAQDFVSGNCSLYLLTAAEVDQLTEIIRGQA